MTLALYAGSSRFTTSRPDRCTRHSFSFGEHYDPANLGFGPMICHNDDVLEPGGGYPDHPHTDLEIVTWVLDGVLLHTDDAGNIEELRPGAVQVMSAGSGIRHAEIGDARSGPTRFLQTWIRPDESGTPPGWRSEHVDPGPGLTTVVGDGALHHRHPRRLARRCPPAAGDEHAAAGRRAAARLRRGRRRRIEDRVVGPSDAVRLTDQPGATFEATTDTELLVWSFTR